MGSSHVAFTETSDIELASSKGFLNTEATIKCGFTLKRVRHMIRAYSQIHRTNKYSEYKSIIWLLLLNDWLFIYNLTSWRFESRGSLLDIALVLRKDFLDMVAAIECGFSLKHVREHNKEMLSNTPYR